MHLFKLESFRTSLLTAMVISVSCIDSVMMAYDSSLMGSLIILPSYLNYFNLSTATIALNSCALQLGTILIVPLVPAFVNWKGRRFGIVSCAVLNIIGAVISGAAQNIAMFIVGRMILGVAGGIAQTSATAYISETTDPKVRPFALGMYFSCYGIGAIMAAGISYGSSSLEPSTWAWRLPSLLQCVPALALLTFIMFLPESPRWLAYNGRYEEALDVLARIAGAPKEDHLVQLQYHEVIETMQYESAEGHGLGFREIIRTPANRKRLFLALSMGPLVMLSGSNIVSYYFGAMLTAAGITNYVTQLKINLILCTWQFVAATTGSILVERLGRRLLCLGSLGGATAFLYIVGGMTAVYGSSGSQSGVYGTVACIFLFLGSFSFGITPLTSIYPGEVLSFRTRATGVALLTLTTRMYVVLITFALPYMFDSIQWKTYMVNASWNILFWLYVFFQWVETKGMTLEQMDEIFDGVKHADVPNLSDLKDEKMSKQGVTVTDEAV